MKPGAVQAVDPVPLHTASSIHDGLFTSSTTRSAARAGATIVYSDSARTIPRTVPVAPEFDDDPQDGLGAGDSTVRRLSRNLPRTNPRGQLP